MKYIKLFLDNYPTVKPLSQNDKGDVLDALFQYGSGRRRIKLEGAALHVFLTFKSQIDREKAGMEERAKKSRENGQRGGRPKKVRVSEKPTGFLNNQPGFEKTIENREQNTEYREPTTEYREQKTENRVSNTEYRRESIEHTAEVFEAAAPHTLSPAPVKERKGEYGWVQLTAEQYQMLTREYGQEEVDRLIRYVDELVQLNGNKYQWRDWEGVLRKAAREGWGPMKPIGKKTEVKEEQVPEHRPSYDLDEIDRLLLGQYVRS